MPISALQISEAMRASVSAVCASCVRYWEGVDAAKKAGGEVKHPVRCTAKRPCGGPASQMLFPEYQGDIPESVFPTFCFICGETTHAVVKGEKRSLGVCEAHLGVLHTVRRRDPAPEATRSPIVLVDARGRAFLDTDLVKPLSRFGEALRQGGDWIAYERRKRGMPT